MEQATKMHTKDILAKTLEEVGLHEMAAKASEGYYHDFLSPLDTPCIQLMHDLQAHLMANPRPEITKLIERHVNGDFDASNEESDEWAASPEGQQVINALHNHRAPTKPEF